MSGVVGPRFGIVQDGLVLNLDASNTLSYPGSGTTWFDLTSNNNDGTLINGPTFDPANGGSIVFDGLNDYVNLTNISIGTNPFTINIWFKINQNQTTNNALISVAASGTANNFQLSFINDTQLLFFYKGIGVENAFNLVTSFALNTWYNVCITKDSNNNIRSYVNASQTATVNYVANYNFSEIIRLGINRSETNYYNGNISLVQIYVNNGLSDAQVLQNYNALKNRFKLE